MPAYGYRQRRPEENFFADIRYPNGASSWEHVRTNLGRKVAFAMISKHHDGHGKIVAFRDESQMTSYDREGLEQGSDGVLRKNVWAGLSANESYWGAR